MQARRFKYEEIAQDATSRFLADYEPGERLPSENDMRIAYGVSRMTIRQARQQMLKTGQFVVRQGAGMFMAPYAVDGSFTDGMPDDAWVHDAARALHRHVCVPGYVPAFGRSGPPDEWKPWEKASKEHQRRDLKVAERIIRDSLGWLIAELACIKIDQE